MIDTFLRFSNKKTVENSNLKNSLGKITKSDTLNDFLQVILYQNFQFHVNSNCVCIGNSQRELKILATKTKQVPYFCLGLNYFC